MAAKVYHGYFTVREVHDGDTIYGDLDQGLDSWHHNLGLRVAGINARELADPGGKEARDNLASLVHVGDVFPIASFRWDKYANRIDASVTLPDGRTLATVLIAAQWAAAWDGRGRKEDHVPPWPRTITP